MPDAVTDGRRAHGQPGPAALVCTPKALPRELWIEAASRAREINPLNYAPIERLTAVLPKY